MKRRRISAALAALACLAAGCATRRSAVMELSGSVMYEKPRIVSVTHTLADARPEGGVVSVRIVMVGDPGLQATFDISPGIAQREPMTESGEGSYVGRYDFPKSTVGGPFTVFGRVAHEKAGEVVLRDVQPITITVFEPGG